MMQADTAAHASPLILETGKILVPMLVTWIVATATARTRAEKTVDHQAFARIVHEEIQKLKEELDERMRGLRAELDANSKLKELRFSKLEHDVWGFDGRHGLRADLEAIRLRFDADHEVLMNMSMQVRSIYRHVLKEDPPRGLGADGLA